MKQGKTAKGKQLTPTVYIQQAREDLAIALREEYEARKDEDITTEGLGHCFKGIAKRFIDEDMMVEGKTPTDVNFFQLASVFERSNL